MDQNEWTREYAEFVRTEPLAPPAELARGLREKIHASLHPGAWKVLRKLAAIHLIASGLTLAVCPQFGIGPLGGGQGLMAIAMGFGPWACALFCGSFFLGSSALAASLLLRPEEARVVRRHQLWQFSLLALISVLVLMLAGAAARGHAVHLAPEFLATWLMAAVLGSQLAWQLGATMRSRLTPR